MRKLLSRKEWWTWLLFRTIWNEQKFDHSSQKGQVRIRVVFRMFYSPLSKKKNPHQYTFVCYAVNSTYILLGPEATPLNIHSDANGTYAVVIPRDTENVQVCVGKHHKWRVFRVTVEWVESLLFIDTNTLQYNTTASRAWESYYSSS